MKKILITVLLFLSASFAQFYYTPSAQWDGADSASSAQTDNAFSAQTDHCSGDLAELSIQKRALAKKFGECAEKISHYTVSLLFFTLKEGESGQMEEAKCFAEYVEMFKPFATCFKTRYQNTLPFSIDERNSYLYYWAANSDDSRAFNELLAYMLHYKQIQEKEAGLEILDRFNTFDEELALRNVSLEDMEKKIAEANGSREDKDILRLYFKYIKAKYNYRFRCNMKSSFVCDTSWLGDEKNAFLKKYPESDYRDFVETQMPGFIPKTVEEKKQAKEENLQVKLKIREQEIARKIAERDVWVALTGIAMFGIPVTSTSGFDHNFNVSTMFGGALRASYRRAFFQYQYNFSLGGNNEGGSTSEKSYSLMLGGAIGPKKIFTIDLFAGLSYIDTYPNDSEMPHPNLDYSSWTLGAQGNYYIPMTESCDMVAFAQVRMNYVENYCRESFVEKENGHPSRCRDPYSSGSTGASSWEDLQWTFSLGVAVRFWKPKPASWY